MGREEDELGGREEEVEHKLGEEVRVAKMMARRWQDDGDDNDVVLNIELASFFCRYCKSCYSGLWWGPSQGLSGATGTPPSLPALWEGVFKKRCAGKAHREVAWSGCQILQPLWPWLRWLGG